jgi:hypothetical protein
MPIPKPSSSEKESDYINRCMHAIGDEYTDKKQAVAICYNTYRTKKSVNKLAKIFKKLSKEI